MATEGREIPRVRPVENGVDGVKELKAHEFRFKKRTNLPPQVAVLQVIRADEGIWSKVEPSLAQQQKLERATALLGETQRVSAALFRNIYCEDPEAAGLYDLSLLDATQLESALLREQIRKGNNYAPLVIDGAGGVYGTIFSAAALKTNPDNPPLGFDASERRAAIWGKSGDVTLETTWWNMNSRNREEKRKIKQPGEAVIIAPGTEDNLNTLGAETQNLQVPDITGAQYPGNNDMGRVLSHDNFISNNLGVNSELVKIRQNSGPGQKGAFKREYQDKKTGERFFVYSDMGVQATGLGEEQLGFSPLFDCTQEVLAEVEKDLAEGIKTPNVVTFLQLIQATTSNRQGVDEEFLEYGLEGTNDTSRIIRERSFGIGGVETGLSAQEGFTKKVVVFGSNAKKTREEASKTERPRYLLGLLEFEREGGGFFRVEGVDGRIVGLGKPKDQTGVIVYYERVDQTPEGEVKSIGTKLVPKLVIAAGFSNKESSDRIYSGLHAKTISNELTIFQRIEEASSKAGSTIYFKNDGRVAQELGINRIDINMVGLKGKMISLSVVDNNGIARTRIINKENLSEEDALLLSPSQIAKLEIAGEPPKFEPVIDPEYDSEIPIAEKAQGFELYKVGACTSYPLTDKERRSTTAYEKVPANTKSIFRFEEPVKFFAQKLAKSIQAVPGSLNLAELKPETIKLDSLDQGNEGRTLITVPIEPRALVQELPKSLKIPNLLRYLAASKLNCIFPEGLEGLSLGIKRVKRPGEDKAFDLQVKFDQAIPDNDKWQVIDDFIKDPLVQRVLVRLTNQSTNSAELKIGTSQRRLDIRKVEGRSVKNTDLSQFENKYNQLARSKKETEKA